MLAHICKHNMLRKCPVSRCKFCRNKKKRPDNVTIPAKDADRFNEKTAEAQVATLKQCRTLIKKQSAMIDEFFYKILNLNYQQKILLEVVKRTAKAINAMEEDNREEAERLIDSTKPLMEEAFVVDQEPDDEKEKEDQKGEKGCQDGNEETS